MISLPAHLSAAQREEMVEWLVARAQRQSARRPTSDTALLERAVALGRRYVDGAEPAVVRWVDNQRTRWASCSHLQREIRVSSRLRPVPGWVLDAVLVHELCHLVYPDHGPQFQALAARYPRAAEAATYLRGFADGLSANERPALGG